MSLLTTRTARPVYPRWPVIQRASRPVRARDGLSSFDKACGDPSRWKDIEGRPLAASGSTLALGDGGGLGTCRQGDWTWQSLGEKRAKARAIPS
jgi:hypothetical protein